MDLVKFLNQMDRKIIFLLLIIFSFLPVIFPLGLPVPIQEITKLSFDALDELSPGDLIAISFDYAGGSAAELYPQNLVMMKHALDKDLRIITIAFAIGGPEMAEKCIRESGYESAKEYGVDYVNLGYAAGFETAMSAFASDPHSLLAKDFYGTPLENIPIMDDFHNIEDLKFIAFTTSTSQDHYIRQWTGYSTKVVGCIQSLYFSVMNVYMGTGQIVGFINGLRGSAEYELLSNHLGVGVMTMDQASVTHLYAILLLVVGNIGYFALRSRGKRGEA